MIKAKPVSVVGMACRFPRAKTLGAFWDLLIAGRDATSELLRERWPVNELRSTERKTQGTLVSARAGLLDEIRGFDARFFGITPREAEAMDPQQRIALEVAYEALEDAGVVTGPPQRLGVFVGAWSAEYSRRFHRNMTNETLQYWGTGNTLSVIANRISYAFNFRGTSMTVDTASSSSLLAIHLACRAIEANDVDRALVGGVNLLIDPITSVYFSKIGALSPDGLSKSFDADANGYVRSEGCGFVVLERSEGARERQQRIYAQVLGTGSNQDGRSAGLTVPNGDAQRELILETLERATLKAEDITYVEAHASGTPVGDPVEMAAIGEAYATGLRPEPLRIGSVKSNIGHLEAASGIAGFIKAVLAVERSEIPPTLHYQSPNPDARLGRYAMQVQNARASWPTCNRRIAAVNSFGLGGTNVHVIVGADKSPAEDRSSSGDTYLPLVLSARSDASLKDCVLQMISFFRKNPSLAIQDVAGTLALRRCHYDHRIVAIGRSLEEWCEKLETYLDGGTPELFAAGSFDAVPGPGSSEPVAEKNIVLVFPGQGAQWLGMGRQLFRSDGSFRDEILRVEAEMKAFRPWRLSEMLMEGPESALLRLDIVQPLLFSVGIGIAAVFRDRGLEAKFVVGHSQGEVAAAYVSGNLSLSDACRVVCARSELVEKTRGTGQMAVAALASEEADEFAADHGLSVAAYNSPRTVIVAGQSARVEAAVETLQQRGVFARVLRIGYASHSPAMAPIEKELREKLGQVFGRTGKGPTFKSTTIADGSTPSFDADYWWRNLREPVRFSSCIQSLANAHATFVEVAPHPGLETALAESVRDTKRGGRVVSTLRRDCDEMVELMRTAADLFVNGHPIRWSSWGIPQSTRSVPLPAYAWEHNDFWIPLQEQKDPGGSALESRPPSLAPSVANEISFAATVRSTPRNERLALVRARVSEVVYRLAKLGRRKGDLETPLKTLGFDSILFRALEGELADELGVSSSAALLMSYGTISAISDAILEQVFAHGSQSMSPEEAPTLTSLEAMLALDKALEDLE